jgi:hypothetical protein
MKRYLQSYQRPKTSADKRREYNWRKNGVVITVSEYDRIFEAQGGACAICLRKKRLAVDHDHATGIVRGLLCDYCNRRLLVPQNTVEVFERAAAYLAANTPAAPAP